MSDLTIFLTEQIPSGKNQQQLDLRGKYPRRFPNPRFEQWRDMAEAEILCQRRNWPRDVRMLLPLTGDIVMTISYRPLDKRGRDLSGMLDAIQHLLEHAEIIANDGQIKGLRWVYPWRVGGPCVMLQLKEYEARR